MADPREFKMGEDERLWWARVRQRGVMWFVVNKGLVFLFLYPLLGCFAVGWEWDEDDQGAVHTEGSPTVKLYWRLPPATLNRRSVTRRFLDAPTRPVSSRK